MQLWIHYCSVKWLPSSLVCNIGFGALTDPNQASVDCGFDHPQRTVLWTLSIPCFGRQLYYTAIYCFLELLSYLSLVIVTIFIYHFKIENNLNFQLLPLSFSISLSNQKVSLQNKIKS